MHAYKFATSDRLRPALKHRLVTLKPAEPISRWRSFVAGLWSAVLALVLHGMCTARAAGRDAAIDRAALCFARIAISCIGYDGPQRL